MMQVEHHIHYREIDGFDKTVWMEMGEHVRLHNRLRREGKCKIPVDILTKISNRANKRTVKSKQCNKQYRQTDIFKQYQKQYDAIIRQTINFTETLQPYIVHREFIKYNKSTGNVQITCFFDGNGGKKIFYIDISNG